MVSDAAMPCTSAPLPVGGVELWLSGVRLPGVVEAEGDFAGASLMADWEEEREKVLARGARCVSLSSMHRVSIKEAYSHAGDDGGGVAYSW